MDKKEFIRRQLAKTNKKDFEHYVITRIIHKLDDLDVKFVTQQYVKRIDGYALADLYFPQINYFIEVDEPQHLKKKEADKLRDADFELMTGTAPRRISVARKSLAAIHAEIDKTVRDIQRRIETQKKRKKFVPWDPAKELNPDTWIARKCIRVEDKVAFRTSADACRCMGLNYKRLQRGGVPHPHEPHTLIWFPKLYPNQQWNNDYDEESGIITERCEISRRRLREHVAMCLRGGRKRRIVFARVKDNLGDIKYRFRGVFRLDEEATNDTAGVIWKRISNEARTYDYR